MKKSFLYSILGISCFFLFQRSYSQIISAEFSLQNKADRIITLDTILKETTLLDIFDSGKKISGFALSGEITLHSETSLVRIVLIDNLSDEYLVLETYPLLAGSQQFSVEDACEETCLLNNVIPRQVSVEIIDASLNIKDFTMSSRDCYSPKAKTENSIRRNALKIDRINRNIPILGQKWVAGGTSVSDLSYQEKKRLFGGRIPNLQGYEYYVGGFMELPVSTPQEQSCSESPYPDEFSWKNRHGTDWTTAVKSQEGCGTCWAFGPTAAVELMVNLYFNRKLDYDLSEQNLIACTDGRIDCGTHQNSLDYMAQTGIVPENCFPYEASEMLCKDICSDPSERVMITGWSDHRSADEIKREIIQGAAAASIRYWAHIVAIVGYRVIRDHDSLFIRDKGKKSWINIEPGNELVGKTAWHIKNSWGNTWGDEGYGYLVENSYHIEVHCLNNDIISSNFNTKDIRCTDNDRDGYYFWGIGDKPSHCPYSPADPDGDDSNPNIGPADQYGNSTFITTDSEFNLQASLFEIIPNLLQKKLAVRSKATNPTTICITTLEGKMLYGFSMTDSYHSINLSNLDGGIYIIKLSSGNSVAYKKLLLL